MGPLCPDSGNLVTSYKKSQLLMYSKAKVQKATRTSDGCGQLGGLSLVVASDVGTSWGHDGVERAILPLDCGLTSCRVVW